MYCQNSTNSVHVGPTTATTDDFKTFWKMVWHVNCEKIVMLTNLTENGV